MKRSGHPSFVFIGGTSEPGGLHVHTADVAMAATRAGHDVTIICPSIDHFSAMFGETPVRVEVIPPRAANESPRVYWRRHLSGHARAHAVLCRGKLAESSIGDLMGIRLATRRLFTIEHRAIENPKLSRHDLQKHGWAMRATIRRVICVSEEISASAIRDLGLPRSMVTTCMNWFDPIFQPHSREQRQHAKESLGISDRTLVIGYHGRLAPEKRLPALIDAFAAVTPPNGMSLKMVLIGDGWKRRALEEQIQALGIADRVLITGWHPDPQEAVAALDISVLPSLSEGFPLGLLEAMASGTACLAHPMSSTCSIIDPACNGRLADLSDPSSFQSALQELISMPEDQRMAMGRAASISMAQHYSRAARLPAVLSSLGIDSAAGQLPARNRRLAFVK